MNVLDGGESLSIELSTTNPVFFRQSYRRPVLASSSVQCGGKKSNNLAGNSTREESLQTFVTQNPIFETGICSENPFLSLIPLITPVPGV
jgi:hypothetical protein